MSIEVRYVLNSKTIVEPVINSWYAHGFLVNPLLQAMCAEKIQKKILQSYLSAPHIHLNVAKKKMQVHGPFVQWDKLHTDSVERFVEETNVLSEETKHLSRAMEHTFSEVKKDGTGFSLKQTYKNIPECLKGYMELSYDLNNHASPTLFEGLLYRGTLYNESIQEIHVSLSDSKRLPVYNTPRIVNTDAWVIKKGFKDPFYDRLFRLRHQAKTLREIQDELNLTASELAILQTYLVPETETEKIDHISEIHYFSHHSVLIKSENSTVLIDPMVFGEEYKQLPDKIDTVIITSSDPQHLVLETLIQLRSRIGQIIVPRNNTGAIYDPSIKLLLEALGFTRILELDDFEEVYLEGGKLNPLSAFGGYRSFNVQSKMNFYLELGNKNYLFLPHLTNASDFDALKRIVSDFNSVNTCFINKWVSEKYKNFTLDFLMSKANEPYSKHVNEDEWIIPLFKDFFQRINPDNICLVNMGYQASKSHLSTSTSVDPLLEKEWLLKLKSMSSSYGIKLYDLENRYEYELQSEMLGV